MKSKFAIVMLMSCLIIGTAKADNPIMACYDISSIDCTAPSIDIGEDGRIHFCWRESRGEGNELETFTCYRCYHSNGSPTPAYTPSFALTSC